MQALRTLALGAGTSAALLLSGCVQHHYHCPDVPASSASSTAYYGPPASVSHGTVYHYYDQDVTLIFDADWGGYWVRDYPDHYYYGGEYFYWYGRRWHRGHGPHGPWVLIDIRDLPGRLDRHHMRIAKGEALQSWHDAAKARKDAEKERAAAEREERKDERQDARREEHAERHDEAREAREERHEARDERRDDQRAAREEVKEERHPSNEPRDEVRQQAPRDERWDQREARQEVREERREERSEGRPEHAKEPKTQESAPANASDDDDTADDAKDRRGRRN